MWERFKTWWKGTTAVVADTVAAPTSRGFFSTDINFHGRGDERDLEKFLGLMQPKVFQREQPKVTTLTWAMDGAAQFAEDSYEWSGMGAKSPFGSMLGGAAIPEAQMLWYAGQSFIGYQMCAVLVQNWLIDKVCTIPAKDAMRNWYEVTVNDGQKVDPKLLDEVRKLDKKFKLKKNCVEFIRSNKIFGIRIALFEVDSPDPDYYLKPFNPDGVLPNSYRGISQVDPYWITPELDFKSSADPSSQHFYEPTWWRINGKRYHRTHLVVIRTCDLPDVLKPTYFYGGIPLPQQIAERIFAAERTANEAPQLALSKRSTVVHVDLAEAAANQASLEKKLQLWSYLRDNWGVKVAGLQEKVEQFDTALADMDDLIMTQYQLVAAIGRLPATKVLGTTPKGFQSTGEYEESNYHEELESLQEHEAQPLIERHHLLLMKSEIEPKFNQTFNITIKWNELDAETSKEAADRRLAESNADKNYAEAGAVDGIDIRNKLINDPDSGYTGIEEAIPEGPRPQTVIDPDAPKTAPNTPPGQTPTPAPATTPAAAPPKAA